MSKLLPVGLLASFLLSSCDPFTMFEPQDTRSARPYGQSNPYGPDRRPLPPRDPRMNQDPYGPTTAPEPRRPDPVPTRGQYPVAERTANPNQVISPYEPYNVIDVEGFSSGQLAKDPSNQKIFRIP